MAEALPHPLTRLQPISKPKPPGSFDQLDITPEKGTLQKNPETKNVKPFCRKKVAFADDLKKAEDSKSDAIINRSSEKYPRYVET